MMSRRWMALALLALVMLGDRLVVPWAEPRAAVGGVATPLEATSTGDLTGIAPFVAGFSVYLSGSSLEEPDQWPAMLDRIRSLNVTSVGVVFPIFQDGPRASRVYRHPELTPTDGALSLFVDLAHDREMSVFLRPLLDEASLTAVGAWRGSIVPDDREAWSASYGAVIAHYGRLSETSEVEMLSVGTTLDTMEVDVDGWTRVVAGVRAEYDGLIAYSVNYGRQELPFADAIDVVGLTAFYDLDPDEPTTAGLVRAWDGWLEQVRALEQATGKWVLITEIGARSRVGSYRQPWRADQDGEWDEGDQAMYLEAACRVVTTAGVDPDGAALLDNPAGRAVGLLDGGSRVSLVGQGRVVGEVLWLPVAVPETGDQGWVPATELGGAPLFSGMYIWGTTTAELRADPATDLSYSPFGKAGEEVIRDCYAAVLAAPRTAA